MASSSLLTIFTTDPEQNWEFCEITLMLWLEIKNLVYFFMIIIFKLIWDTKQAHEIGGSYLYQMNKKIIPFLSISIFYVC